MNTTAPKTDLSSLDLLVADLMDEFTERLNRGEQPEIEEYVHRCPQMATMLRQVFGTLQLIHGPETEIRQGEGISGVSARYTGELGDFRILREIGRGGMGVVYEAEQLSLGRRVALKVLPFAPMLDPRRLLRFQNEVRAAAALKHANIVQVYSVGCERGVHYYAMEYVEGKTLSEVIHEMQQAPETVPPAGSDEALATAGERAADKSPPAAEAGAAKETATTETHRIPHAEISTQTIPSSGEFFTVVAHWGIQAAEALEHAHQLGIVHRDIKPSNLMVDAQRHLWVTDFGLAMTANETDLTMSGDVVGTLRYMSPEQVRAKHGLLDHRTDVYSLGITLYELLTLRPAYTGEDRQDLMRRIGDEDPPPPRQLTKRIPHDLETILLKAITKEPQGRYSSAQEMADDLRRFLANEPIHARRPSIWERASLWSRRHRTLIRLSAVFLVVITVLLAVGTVMIARGYRIQSAERARAETNLRVAMEAVDQIYLSYLDKNRGRFSGKERTLGGPITPEGKQLLTKAMTFYEKFAAANRDELLQRSECSKAYARISLIQARLGMYDQGERTAEKAIAMAAQLNVESPEAKKRLAEAYRNHAFCCLGQNKLDEARVDLEQAIRLVPDDSETNTGLGTIRFLQGDFPGAMANLNRALELNPKDTDAYSIRGAFYINQGDFDRAIKEFTKALQFVDSQDAAIHYRFRAMAFYRKRLYDQALNDLNAALSIEPRNSEVLCERGTVLLAKRNLEGAIADFDAVLKLDPANAKAYYNRGCARIYQNDLQKAIVDFSSAIKINPLKGWPFHNRGSAHAALDRLDEAIKDFTEAIKLGPQEFMHYHARGRIHWLKQNFSVAIQDFDTAYRLRPTDTNDLANAAMASELHNGLAWVLATCPEAELRNPRRAVELAAESIKLWDNPGQYQVLGVARYRAGDYPGAIEVLKKDAFKPNATCRDFFLAMAHWQRGNAAEAKETYQKAAKWLKTHEDAQMTFGRFQREAAELLGIDLGAVDAHKLKKGETTVFQDHILFPWSQWMDPIYK
jgi:tetratricopeptide (TPR) repeat protein/tRNA A-37 threonylcarbamoyl transferase component Bud32